MTYTPPVTWLERRPSGSCRVHMASSCERIGAQSQVLGPETLDVWAKQGRFGRCRCMKGGQHGEGANRNPGEISGGLPSLGARR